MTAVVGSDAAVDSWTSRTLEEQLRRTHGHLCLAADLVDLQAVAPDVGWPDGLSPAACAALGGVYRHASHELEATLATVPATVLHHGLGHSRNPIAVEGDVGSSEPPVPPHTLDDPEGAHR